MNGILGAVGEAPDIIAPVTAGFSGFAVAIMALAATGIGIRFVLWGLPRGVRFVQKLAG